MYKILFPIIFAVFAVSAAFNSVAHSVNGKDKPLPAPKSLGQFIYQVQLDKEKAPILVSTGWFDEFIEPDVNDSLFGALFRKVRTKELKLYEPYYPFNVSLDPESAINRIRESDTTFIEDIETGELLEVAVIDETDPEEVVSVIFDEEWFFDASTLTLTKKVKGIIPVINVVNNYGEVVGAKGLFYVPFNEGDIKHRDFHVDEISFDYSTDTAFINHDYYSVSVDEDSVLWAKQDVGEALVMTAAKSYCHGKKAVFNYPGFPYNKPVDAEDRKPMLPLIDSATIMRFSEDWTADLNAMIFQKRVHGIILADEKKFFFFGDESADPYFMMHHVFIPLNGYSYQSSPAPVYIDRITYAANYQANPFFRYPVYVTRDSAALAAMLNSMCSLAKTGKISVYGDRATSYSFFHAWDRSAMQEYTPSFVDGIFAYREQVYIEDPDNPDIGPQWVRYEYNPDHFCGFTFLERWKYDPAAISFDKEIFAIGCSRFVMDGDIQFTSHVAVPFGYYPAPPNKDSIVQPKYLVAKNVLTPVQVNWNEFYATENSEGMIFDYYVNETQNIQPSKRYAMVQGIIEQVLAGKMIAWHANDPVKQFTIPEFNSMLDTVTSRNKIYGGRTFAYAAFSELTFDEDWYYNPATGQMYKRVNAITFGTRSYFIGGTFGEVTWKDEDPAYFTVRMKQ